MLKHFLFNLKIRCIEEIFKEQPVEGYLKILDLLNENKEIKIKTTFNIHLTVYQDRLEKYVILLNKLTECIQNQSKINQLDFIEIKDTTLFNFLLTRENSYAQINKILRHFKQSCFKYYQTYLEHIETQPHLSHRLQSFNHHLNELTLFFIKHDQ